MDTHYLHTFKGSTCQAVEMFMAPDEKVCGLILLYAQYIVFVEANCWFSPQKLDCHRAN